MKRIRLFLTVVVVLVAASALVACGESTVDNGDVEEQAQAFFDAGKEQGGPAVTDIDCEDDLKAEKGETVDCTGKADGQDVKFTANVVSVDDDTASLDFKVAE